MGSHLAFLVSIVLSMTAVSPAPAAAQFASEQDRREALQHYRAGQELLSAEQFQKAVDAFQRAIDKDRLLTLAHYRQGQAYMALRRYASAARAFTDCRETFRMLHRLAEANRFGVERQRDEELREMRDTVRRLREDRRRVRDARIMRLEARISDVERQRTSLNAPFRPPAEVSLALGSAHFRNEQLDEAEREWKGRGRRQRPARRGSQQPGRAVRDDRSQKEAEAAVRSAERAGFRVHPQLKDDIRTLDAGK